MEQPNVLFVVLDSMRRDRVSAYGHDRETTPNLDALAETATQYEHAYTPTPWTLPSHTSMFTGRMPSEHGITNGFKGGDMRLSSEIPTLAERLSAAGYETAGFSNNPWVGTLSGLNRGFDEFVEWDLEITRRDGRSIHGPADLAYSKAHTLVGHASRQPAFLLKRPFFTSNLVDRAKRWLDETLPAPRPSFTFLNLMEAHSPYFPPDSAFEELGLETPGPIEARTLNTKLLAYVLGQMDLTPERRERVMEFYDACLRYQDRKVEELLATLRTHRAFDDTLIVVCADHGKTLGDVDRDVTPPHYVHEHNTDVPLWVKRPGQRTGERVSEPANLAGLFDAVLDAPTNPREPLCDEYALVEDFVPHTGNERAESTRWRVLCEPERRYVRSEEGAEYVIDADGVDRAPSGPDRDRMREALDRRVETLATDEAGAESADDLSSSVEAQLGDLGYLE